MPDKTTHPHPWYGPCDGIADGECTECLRQNGKWPPSYGQLSAEDRAAMFMDWCALNGFGLSGWPPGARDQLVAHIRQGEQPFPLKD